MTKKIVFRFETKKKSLKTLFKWIKDKERLIIKCKVNKAILHTIKLFFAHYKIN